MVDPRIAWRGERSFAENFADSLLTSWWGENVIELGNRIADPRSQLYFRDPETQHHVFFGYRPTPGYNPFRSRPDLNPRDYTLALQARSDAELDNLLKTRRDTQRIEGRLAEEGAGVSSFLAGVFDPINVLPFPVARGVGMWKGALKGGASVGAMATAMEATREFGGPETAGQYGMVFGGSALFGAAFGAVAGRMGPEGPRAAERQMGAMEDLDRGIDTTQKELRAAAMFPEGVSAEAIDAGQEIPLGVKAQGREDILKALEDARLAGLVPGEDWNLVRATVNAMPDRWLERVRLTVMDGAAADTAGVPKDALGLYQIVRDQVSLFMGPEMQGRTSLVLSHEFGHRAMFYFVDEKAFDEARALWEKDVEPANRALAKLREGGEDLEGVTEAAAYRASFSEWFADGIMRAVADKAHLKLDATTGPLSARARALFDKVIDEITAFAKRLAASLGLHSLSHRDLMENFFRKVLHEAKRNERGTFARAEQRLDLAERATGLRMEQIFASAVDGIDEIPFKRVDALAGYYARSDRFSEDDAKSGKAAATIEKDLAKAEGETADIHRIARTGVGLERTRWQQLPYYVAKNNMLPGLLGAMVSRLADQIAGAPGLRLFKNENGIATDQSAFSLAQQWWARYSTARREMDKLYMEYLGAARADVQLSDWSMQMRDVLQLAERSEFGKKVVTGMGLPTTPEGKLSYKQFREEVGAALHMGDEHPDELVKRAAALWRKEVLEPFEEAARTLGMFGVERLKRETASMTTKIDRLAARMELWTERREAAEADGRGALAAKIGEKLDEMKSERQELEGQVKENEARLKKFLEEETAAPKGAESFFPVRWALSKIDANPEGLRKILYDWFRKDHPEQTAEEISERVTLTMGRIRKLAQRNALFHDEMDPAEAIQTAKEKLAAETDKTARDTRRAAAGEEPGFAPASVIKRKLDIPPLLVREFLDMDVDRVMHGYVRGMGAAVELARLDSRLSGGASSHLEGTLAKLDALIDDAALTDEGSARALRSEWAIQRKALEDLRDKVLGLYGIPEDPTAWDYRAIAAAKNFSTITVMGQTWKAALTDAGSSMIAVGVRDFLGGLATRFFGGAAEFKLGRAEVELSGEALDVMRGVTLQRLADQLDLPYSGITKGEQILHEAANKMHLINLLAPWTDFIKGFSGAIIQSNLIKHSIAWSKGTLSKADQTKMAALGIDESLAREIAEQWEAVGAMKGTKLHLANSGAWKNLEVAERFRAALGDAVRTAVVTPGPADRPNFMSAGIWSAVLQYRGFAMGATQRVLMAGMQTRDAYTMSGMLAMVGIGYMIDLMKSSDYDKRSLVSGERLLRAVEYSGVTGILSDINNMIEVASGNSIGVRPALSLDPLVKDPNWAERVGQAGGPAVSPWLGSLWALTAPEASAHDQSRALMRLMPFNNWWFWNDFMRRARTDAADAIEE